MSESSFDFQYSHVICASNFVHVMLPCSSSFDLRFANIKIRWIYLPQIQNIPKTSCYSIRYTTFAIQSRRCWILILKVWSSTSISKSKILVLTLWLINCIGMHSISFLIIILKASSSIGIFKSRLKVIALIISICPPILLSNYLWKRTGN